MINADVQYTLEGRKEAQIEKKNLPLTFPSLVIKYEFYFITSHTKSLFWASDQPRGTPIPEKGVQARR